MGNYRRKRLSAEAHNRRYEEKKQAQNKPLTDGVDMKKTTKPKRKMSRAQRALLVATMASAFGSVSHDTGDL